MIHELLAKQRSEVIEKAINLEQYLNLVVCLHYFKRYTSSFMEEILCDEAFQSALRLNVLMKIAPTFANEQNLRRAFSIRNHFAHCHPLFTETDETGVARLVAIHPKNPMKTIDFDNLHSEFMKLYPLLERELHELLELKGGKLAPWKLG